MKESLLYPYQHSTRQLSDQLTEMQHHHHAVAHAALHIYLIPENCLEVIVLRGAKAEVNALANHLISTKGVLHGKFFANSIRSFSGLFSEKENVDERDGKYIKPPPF